MERVSPCSPVAPATKSEPKTNKKEFDEALNRATELAQKSISEMNKQDQDNK